MSDLSRAIHQVSTYIDCQGYLKDLKVTRNSEVCAAASRVAHGRFELSATHQHERSWPSVACLTSQNYAITEPRTFPID
jgi:hypothetical protein